MHKYLSYILNISGLNKLVSYIYRHRIYIIGYHSVGDRNDKKNRAHKHLCTDTNSFKKEIEYLVKQGHNFITFKDLSANRNITKPTLIYFDDGFRDVITNARPILDKHNIKATFFLSCDIQEGSGSLWSINYRKYLIEICTPDELIEGEVFRLKILGTKEREEKLSQIYEDSEWGEKVDHRELFIDWEEAKRLVREGHEIGSHGASHK